MSGPFRFNQQQQDSRSPLDRPAPNLYPAGQPPSFKTNVNRSKTKKWVEAKPYSYDGDDWGDVDEYDEYGADEPQAPPQPAAVAGLRQPGSRFGDSSRSFTDPQHQEFPQVARRNSFEAGEEHRAFSAGTYPPQKPYDEPLHGAPSQSTTQVHPALRQASAAESDTSDTPQHRRDFNPAALPPPLMTKISPAPGSASGSPLNPKYPLRKSSIGQMDSPVAISPRDRAPSNPTKPLPFIRPADIYKRVEEERQRERTASMDSSRPSLDSLTPRPKEGATSPQGADTFGKSADPAKSLHPLETVDERKSGYLPDYNNTATGLQSQPEHQPPSLPQVRRISAFDNDFWSNDRQNQADDNYAPAGSDDQGLRSAVNQAFTRTDDLRSVPPTPISKSDSGVSRSNTDSTSGISPIMSRVPSSATSALKNRNAAGDGSTPMIAEEASEGSTPAVSRPTSSATMLGNAHQITRKPSPTSHTRDFSNSSLPRSDLTTPSRGESPARSPAVEPQAFVSASESALYSSLSPTSPEAMNAGFGQPVSTYATREADIAAALKLSPTKTAPELGAAEKESQNAFLASHQIPDSPLSDTAPRSESPSKGRVQELAGKFGDVSSSRRGSTQSNASGNSVQSWEKSPDHSRPSSPTKASTSRPISPAKHILGLSERPVATRAEPSFRPKLPGTWESYATTQPTPSDQSDRDMQLSGSGRVTPEGQQVSSPHEEVDLTPTTAKHPVLASDPSKSPTSPSDALAALKAAGAAIGTSLQESVGLGSSSQGRTYGDVHIARPLYVDRTLTTDTTNSSIPPTPPAKDSPESEDLPPPPHLKEKSPEPFAPSSQQQTPVRPTVIPQLSTDISANDLESDRLRKEIVASLTPLKTSETPRDRPSLQSTLAPEANRASSILPSEYDSYWADGDQTSQRLSNDLGRNVFEHPQTSANQSPVAARSTVTEISAAAEPPVSNQYSSREGDQSHPTLQEVQAQSGTDAQASRDLQEKEVASLTTPNVIDKESTNSFQGIPDPYFGPSHVAAVAKPDTVDESDITARLPTPPPNSEKPLSPKRTDTVREAPHPAGLHVVNTELDPEAVDMPPRLSAQISLVSQQSVANPEDAAVSREPHVYQQPTTTAPVAGSATATSAHDYTPKSPTSPSDKPKGFREIVTIKSPSERIATYNQTREYWAKADHGLNDWIASAVATNPQLESAAVLQHRPTVAATTTSRHKATGSLSIFGKKEGSSNAQVPAAPYYEQYNSAAANMPSTPTSSGADPAEVRPQSFSAGPSSGRSASHQMQTKGKDLLHKAELLGGKGLGKGMTSAKGLFAKGKSRFGKSGTGDKASQPNSLSSSREASEEPEFMPATGITTTTPERPPRIMSMSIESSTPKEEKKKRRMSSPFHRSSRSRSRPSSIVLPKNAHFDFPSSTPKSTPPRETPPQEHGREQSFHAPDSWGVTSDPGSNQRDVSGSLSTPPRNGSLQPPERLGVLPSPAKSAFNFLQRGEDEDVPPIPPIPDDMQERVKGRESQESARRRQSQESARQHRLIHSIVRYSTPPAMDLEVDEGMFKDASAPSTVLQPSPTFRDPAEAQGGVEMDTRSQHTGLKTRLLKQTEADGLPSQANTHKEPPRSAPWPEKMAEDENSLPPQLNNNTFTSRSVHGHVQAEEDDDDLPPTLSYEPPQPLYRAPDISPLGSLNSAVPRTKRFGNNEGPPPQLNNSMLQPQVISKFEQAKETEDDLPPQLNYEPPQPIPQATDPPHPAGLSASMPSPTHDEEDDDDLPPRIIYDLPEPIHRTPNLSPPSGPVEHPGEISPVVSSVGIAHKDESDDEVHNPSNLGVGSLMPKSQYRKGDVSPMISVKKTRNVPQPRDASFNEVSVTRLEYETQKIGDGDISPVSLHTQDDDDATPTVAKGDLLLMTPHSRQTAKLAVLEVDQGLSAPLENALAPNTNAAQPPQQPQRIATSPYQILHAVQYFPSTSTLDSIDFSEHESNLAPSQGDRYEEIPPVPPIHPGDTVQQKDDQTPLQRYPEPRQPTFELSKSTGSDKIHPLISEPAQEDSHTMYKAETATSGNHKRTQSLLSAISSMVPGDGVSISSAASSQAGGSRPPSAARHLQGSPAKTSPIPTPILEESGRPERGTMAVPISDDYDLYSDQNGVVKDAPVQVREVARPAQKAKLGAARMVAIPKPAREEDTRRYSDERPMSFVSGPRDAHGRPQEEILSTRSGNIPPVPRIPSHQLQGQTQARPNETIYTSPPPPQPAAEAYEEFYQPGPAPVQLVRRETVSPLHSNLQSERPRTPPHSNVSPPPPSNASPPPQPSPPPVLMERPLLDTIRMQSPIQIPPLQDPRLAGPPTQDPRYQTSPMQDPRFQSPPMQDPRFQSPPVQDPRFKSPPMQDPRFKSPPVQDSRFQGPSPDPRLQNLPARDFSMRDPRSPLDSAPRPNGMDVIPPIPQDPRIHQAQNPKQIYNTPSRMGMPRLGGAGPPRNQYEVQQQQMQRQVVDPRQVTDPRLRNAEYQIPGVAPARTNGQPPKQEEKGSSRPKFASVLKGLTGKPSSSTPQVAQQPTTRIDPSLQVPAAPIRTASYQPGIGDLPEEPVTAKKERRVSAFGSLTSRPKSVGTESHISQDSTKVQAAESRLDLRHPASPAPFKGIPPPQMPQGAPQPTQQQYQAQSQAPNGAPQHFQQLQAQRMSVPESGKKKRFSSLGNLFRTPGQPKLSKDEKRNQKAQKLSSPMSQFQSPPPAQHYNPQQPQQPQQYQVQYGPPPPAATRPFPGMSPASTMSPTSTRSPTSPQRGEYQGMSPQNTQPQGYQQLPYQYQHPPQNAPQHVRQNTPQNAPQNVPQHVPQQVQYGPNGSAISSTKPFAAQNLQPPRPVPQISRSAEDPRPSMQAPAPSLEHPMQRAETNNQPPVAGYYKPDSKRADGEPQNHAPPFIAFEQHQQNLQRQQQTLAPPQPTNQRSVSSPVSSPPPNQVPQAVQPSLQRRVSSPSGEPQYETPPIPGAYNPVKGVFTLPSPHSSPQFAQSEQTATPEPNQYRGSPPLTQSSAQFTQPVYATRSEPTQHHGGPPNTQSPVQYPPPAQAMQAARPGPSPERQYSDPNMQPITPQISALAPNGNTQGRQGSDPNMQPISPQVSAQQGAVSARQYSDVSILDQNDNTSGRHPSDPNMPTISPMVSNERGPSPGMPSVTPMSNQKPQKARMSSITEAAHQERPWNLNVREGATEQEIVRARHHQFMLAQIAAQQEAHAAARSGGSPSPRPSQQSQSPSPRLQEQQQSPQPPISAAEFAGGFREVLPKSSPLPMVQSYDQPASDYVTRSQQHSPALSASPHQRQTTLHPDQGAQPAAYPLPISPASAGARSPVNPVANSLAPPPPPNTTQFQAPPHQHQHQQYQSPYPEEEEVREVDYEKQLPQHEQHLQQPDYEQPPPDEPPPSYNSYSGSGIPHESLEKDRTRPPNISTEAANHGRQARQRQPSIGLLQHPQPASMAASPQRSSADMGADNLRQQLLQQEERARTERLHRAELQRVENERERAERERARARARELERSVSGGTRVGSLRSVAGSGRVPGWERRGSTSRPVFELPAVEDDEPVMRATSFPGQEWVPTFTED